MITFVWKFVHAQSIYTLLVFILNFKYSLEINKSTNTQFDLFYN